MSAEIIMQEASEKYKLPWGEKEMFGILSDYIELIGSLDAFADHVEVVAQEEAAAIEDARGYKSWLKAVDSMLRNEVNRTHVDMPLQTWRTWYDDGLTVGEAVGQALKNEGIESGETYYLEELN